MLSFDVFLSVGPINCRGQRHCCGYSTKHQLKLEVSSTCLVWNQANKNILIWPFTAHSQWDSSNINNLIGLSAAQLRCHLASRKNIIVPNTIKICQWWGHTDKNIFTERNVIAFCSFIYLFRLPILLTVNE